MRMLGIDWGKRVLGLAYSGDGDVVFPLGLHDNNDTIFSDIAHFVMQYRISQIIIGIPKNEAIELKIKTFAQNLSYCVEVPIDFVDESYTTVQAQVILGESTKRGFSDCVAAMEIVKRGLIQKNTSQ